MLDRVHTEAIDPWLRVMVDAGASDLIMTANAAPRIRIGGKLLPIAGAEVLSEARVTDIVMELLDDDQRRSLREELDIDLAFEWQHSVRFRANAFFQQGNPAIVLRLIPGRIPTSGELGLPDSLLNFCAMPQGLVLVTGPTGSGKSTTLAAMIDHCNSTRYSHIITIEDPIEYVHSHKCSLINQRQVGIDTTGFDRALRAALREDPDVLLVGEMRDTETIQIALTASETGHLVFGTMHTNDASQAIDRVIDVFPVERQTQIRAQLAACLSGVVAQRLLPRTDGGMCAAFEVLIANSAVRNTIREGKTHQLRNLMQQGVREGMTLLEKSLSELVSSGLVSYDDAVARASVPTEIRVGGPAGAAVRR